METPDEVRAYLKTIGKRGANARQRFQGACIVCGKPIEGLALRHYCGQTCRTKAYRQRKREQAGAEPATTRQL